MNCIDKLIFKLKKDIIDNILMEDLEPEDIDENESLFKGKLGLDSVDALELVVLLKKNYGIIFTDSQMALKTIESISSIAEHIHQRGENNNEETIAL